MKTKQKKSNKIRQVLWYFILALPLLSFLVVQLVRIPSANNVSPLNLSLFAYLQDIYGLLTNNIVYGCFNGIFGASGVLPLFNESGVLLYMSYFVAVELCHVVIDVLLLLPTIIHNFFDKVGGSCEKDF